jgi:hypothetical protein
MTDADARSERIAIKMDSHISEADAIAQTDSELKPKPSDELRKRIAVMAEKQHQDKIDKRMRAHKPEVAYVERGEK